jgi:ATP-dependent RNA helicase DeaD
MNDAVNFRDLGLDERLLQALTDVGYETPSPIQQACIPPLLQGRDLLGEAQTGTGKTAAFALPLLQRLDLTVLAPQVLVLTPTRELAIQVAEAFQRYAKHLGGLHVLPVYGGQGMDQQLRQLRRGVHVIVGTPGRVMDHLERGTLKLDGLRALVLDEADEMLRMGFIDAVEWILEHTPPERQTALFSATMAEPIRRVARTHMREPEEVRIKASTRTVATIHQLFWQVSGTNKLDALTRILEAGDDIDATLVFVRTKTATVELAERLEARGHSAAALNGDMSQQLRERVIEQLKSGALDIVVATDVAARGIDVSRVSHVINYDIPYDTEAYVHRIGRTGRAGREGTAILFVAPREIRMLRTIERVTRQPIEPLRLPSREAVADKRVARFRKVVAEVMLEENLDFFADVVAQLQEEHEGDIARVAAALMFLAQESKPLKPAGADWRSEAPPAAPAQAPAQVRREAPAPRESWPERKERAPHGDARDERPVREDRPERVRPPADRAPREERAERSPRADRAERAPREDMPERYPREDRGPAPQRDRKKTVAPLDFGGEADSAVYRIAVGNMHGATPREIVGAIANEAGIGSRYIGRIDIREDHTLIDLPAELPNDVLGVLRKTRVRQTPLAIRLAEAADTGPRGGTQDGMRPPKRAPRPFKPGAERPAAKGPAAGKAKLKIGKPKARRD